MMRTIYSGLLNNGSQVVVGPGVGWDSAVVRSSSDKLVLTSDPITGTTGHVGRHSVEINANDIATTGARPKWFLCTILLPIGAREDSLKEIAGDMRKACRRLGVSLVGGHTEVTPRVDRPILSGFMVGEASGRILNTGSGRLGDRVLMTKTAGLEGAQILATDRRSTLRREGVSDTVLKSASDFRRQISIVEEALLSAKIQEVHAMHDPTEGGVLNGLWELAEASGVGIELWADKIPVAPSTRAICFAERLDPLRLMSSGALLLAVQPSKCPTVRKMLSDHGIESTEVGVLTRKDEGRFFIKREKKEALTAVSRDELYRII